MFYFEVENVKQLHSKFNDNAYMKSFMKDLEKIKFLPVAGTQAVLLQK